MKTENENHHVMQLFMSCCGDINSLFTSRLDPSFIDRTVMVDLRVQFVYSFECLYLNELQTEK